jgi:MFS family permease
MTLTDDTVAEPDSVWHKEFRTITVGVLLLVTLTAFEAMGVNTALPSIVSDLHGGALYAWPTITFLAASVFANVLSGRWCDRKGPRLPLLAGPLAFCGGLLVSASAQTMAMLLLGRLLQGIGSGTMLVALFVLIAQVYSDRLRPKVFAAMATAWVLPAVLGPTLAGLVTQWASWRWVFLSIVPLVFLGLALLVPAVRQLDAPSDAPARRRMTVLAAACASFGIAGVSWAAEHPSMAALGYGAVALAALAFAVGRLLPAGTLTARRGLPATVLSRGLLAGSQASVAAFVPLTLTEVHGYSPAAAGIPLTMVALGWSSASMWQGRHPELSRTLLVRIGFVLLAAGLALFLPVTFGWGPGWLAIPAWVVAGSGMGLGNPSISVLLLRFSPPADRGFNTSALQLADWVGTSVLVGIGGMLVNALGSAQAPGAGVAVLATAMACLAALGAVLAGRAR